jgi:DNA polymerase II small subunit/DNA polymerase delta subunit B
MKNFDDRLTAILKDFDYQREFDDETYQNYATQIKAEIAAQMEPLIKEWMLELVQPDVEADPDMQGNATAKTNRTRNQMKREIRQRINNITLKDCAEALQLEEATK